MKLDQKALVRAALEARGAAYAPYSRYLVGAALLCGDGEVITGCNVENAAYGVSCCAERTALFAAVARGRRSFLALAVAGGAREEALPLGDYAHPCGICRQALYEFAPGMTVLVARSEEDWRAYALEELLPQGFGPANLK